MRIRVQAEATMNISAKENPGLVMAKVREFIQLVLTEVGEDVRIEMVSVDPASPDHNDPNFALDFPYVLTEEEIWALKRHGNQGG